MSEQKLIEQARTVNKYGEKNYNYPYIWTHEVLKKTLSKSNSQYSMGVLINELMVWKYHKEGEILDTPRMRSLRLNEDKLLSKVVEGVKKIKYCPNHRTDLYAQVEADKSERCSKQKEFRVLSFVDDRLNYAKHDEIADAVIKMYESPYNSVYDYIDTITSIIEYKENGEIPSNKVAKAIILGSKEKFYEKLELPSDFKLTLEQLHRIVTEENAIHKKKNLTYDDLIKVQNSDSRLTQDETSKRHEAFYRAWNNDPIPRNKAVSKYAGIFDCPSTAEDHINRIENEFNVSFEDMNRFSVDSHENFSLGRMPKIVSGSDVDSFNQNEKAVIIDKCLEGTSRNRIEARKLGTMMSISFDNYAFPKDTESYDRESEEIVVDEVKYLDNQYGIDAVDKIFTLTRNDRKMIELNN